MKVLFIDTVHPVLAERLTATGMTCVDGTSIPAFEAVQAHSDAAGIVIRSRVRVDADFMDRLPDLKFICRSGAGLENIDLAVAQFRGIKVYNSPEGNRDAVGEHALGMLLSLLNLLREADRSLRE